MLLALLYKTDIEFPIALGKNCSPEKPIPLMLPCLFNPELASQSSLSESSISQIKSRSIPDFVFPT